MLLRATPECVPSLVVINVVASLPKPIVPWASAPQATKAKPANETSFFIFLSGFGIYYARSGFQSTSVEAALTFTPPQSHRTAATTAEPNREQAESSQR